MNKDQGVCLDVNPAMLDILGYPNRAGLLQLRSLETYIDPEDRKQFQHRLEEKGFAHDFTVQLRRHDGTGVWVSIDTNIVNNPDNQKSLGRLPTPVMPFQW
jgi:PAS domain S-box-containing protein